MKVGNQCLLCKHCVYGLEAYPDDWFYYCFNKKRNNNDLGVNLKGHNLDNNCPYFEQKLYEYKMQTIVNNNFNICSTVLAENSRTAIKKCLKQIASRDIYDKADGISVEIKIL